MKKVIVLLFITITIGFAESPYWIQALTAKDTKTYISLLEKGVEKNEIQAIQFLGRLYRFGNKAKSVQKDIQKAIEIYTKGSKLEDIESLTSLGKLYSAHVTTIVLDPHVKDSYQRIVEDYTKSIYFYKKAIEKDPKMKKTGYYNSITGLIDEYISHDTTESYRKATELYKASPDLNNSITTFRIGIIYQYGDGGTQDYKQAFTLYKKSADDGLLEAYVNLAYLYEMGYGIKKDKIKAYQYYIKAAKKGYTKAQHNLDILCKESPWACKE